MTTSLQFIPDADYFAVRAVSASLLKKMQSLSPAHALEYFNRPVLPETLLSDEKKESLRHGKLTERALLEPDRLKNMAVKPAGMSFATKEGKTWRESQEGKEIVTSKEYAMITGIRRNVLDHPVLGAILRGGGLVQPALFTTDAETGLPLKSKFDFLSYGNVILDLKSTITANPAPHGFPKEIAKYRYHVQAAVYLSIAEAVRLEFEAAGWVGVAPEIRRALEVPKELFIFAAMEKEPPYAVTAISLDPGSMQKGYDEFRRLIQLYKDCVDNNHFPAYPTDTQIVSLPRWAMADQEYAGDSVELEEA